VLDAHGAPEPVETSAELLAWMALHVHDVTIGENRIERMVISTIFTGVDVGRRQDGPPLLWQTRIFHAPRLLGESEWHYASAADARAGHARTLAMVRRITERRPVR